MVGGRKSKSYVANASQELWLFETTELFWLMFIHAELLAVYVAKVQTMGLGSV